MVTRAKAQAFALSNKIEQYGGIAIEVPLIAFQPPKNAEPIYQAIEHIHNFKWIVFTSANGIDYFFESLKESNRSTSSLSSLKVAVVGAKTEERLMAYGIKADLIPKEFVAESLLESLLEHVNSETPVLIPRGNLAREIIPNGLRKKGIPVTELDVYETVLAGEAKHTLIGLLQGNDLDVITFTSPSTVDHFVQVLEGTNWRNEINMIQIACIGPITAQAVEKNGLTPDIVAKEYTIHGLLQAIAETV
ncbi:uroporphyrinogen-III synthase [Anaerobacillus sp. MEB173]|uniref:uroporphyrinogen-III synthase n=1 Tax=Anaerobacillus sp. MEB173 TaxID=3383345 RepID=UPI003F8ECD4E